jgi:hypothetical protein
MPKPAPNICVHLWLQFFRNATHAACCSARSQGVDLDAGVVHGGSATPCIRNGSVGRDRTIPRRHRPHHHRREDAVRRADLVPNPDGRKFLAGRSVPYSRQLRRAVRARPLFGGAAVAWRRRGRWRAARAARTGDRRRAARLRCDRIVHGKAGLALRPLQVTRAWDTALSPRALPLISMRRAWACSAFRSIRLARWSGRMPLRIRHIWWRTVPRSQPM